VSGEKLQKCHGCCSEASMPGTPEVVACTSPTLVSAHDGSKQSSGILPVYCWMMDGRACTPASTLCILKQTDMLVRMEINLVQVLWHTMCQQFLSCDWGKENKLGKHTRDRDSQRDCWAMICGEPCILLSC
jgi:hypothetical protein